MRGGNHWSSSCQPRANFSSAGRSRSTPSIRTPPPTRRPCWRVTDGRFRPARCSSCARHPSPEPVLSTGRARLGASEVRMTQSRPFGVTLLASLCGLQAVIAAYHTLQFLHILPVTLGQVSFYGFDLLGALIWGVSAACYLWAARMLWQMEEEGW